MTGEQKRAFTNQIGAVKAEATQPVKEEPVKVKGEPVVKAELCQDKEELAHRSGSRCLVEPSKILQLYGVHSAASESPRKKVKVAYTYVDVRINIYIYVLMHMYMRHYTRWRWSLV